LERDPRTKGSCARCGRGLSRLGHDPGWTVRSARGSRCRGRNVAVAAVPEELGVGVFNSRAVPGAPTRRTRRLTARCCRRPHPAARQLGGVRRDRKGAARGRDGPQSGALLDAQTTVASQWWQVPMSDTSPGAAHAPERHLADVGDTCGFLVGEGRRVFLDVSTSSTANRLDGLCARCRPGVRKAGRTSSRCATNNAACAGTATTRVVHEVAGIGSGSASRPQTNLVRGGHSLARLSTQAPRTCREPPTVPASGRNRRSVAVVRRTRAQAERRVAGGPHWPRTRAVSTRSPRVVANIRADDHKAWVGGQCLAHRNRAAPRRAEGRPDLYRTPTGHGRNDMRVLVIRSSRPRQPSS